MLCTWNVLFHTHKKLSVCPDFNRNIAIIVLMNCGLMSGGLLSYGLLSMSSLYNHDIEFPEKSRTGMTSVGPLQLTPSQ